MNRPDSDKKNKSQHFGSSWDSLENEIRNSNADIIGITNLFRENTEENIKTIKIARQVLPKSIIVVAPNPRLNENKITTTIFIPLVLNTRFINGCISSFLCQYSVKLVFNEKQLCQR